VVGVTSCTYIVDSSAATLKNRSARISVGLWLQHSEVHMATAKKVNKSEEIRKALEKHPDKKPKWIAEMLLGKKIEVTPQMVSTIKSKSKAGGQSTKARKNGRIFRGWPGAYGDLQDTLTYIKAVGGLEKAKQLIALVEIARQV
jgi:hypothetical protein